jgi:hypothetical protein
LAGHSISIPHHSSCNCMVNVNAVAHFLGVSSNFQEHF